MIEKPFPKNHITNIFVLFTKINESRIFRESNLRSVLPKCIVYKKKVSRIRCTSCNTKHISKTVFNKFKMCIFQYKVNSSWRFLAARHRMQLTIFYFNLFSEGCFFTKQLNKTCFQNFFSKLHSRIWIAKRNWSFARPSGATASLSRPVAQRVSPLQRRRDLVDNPQQTHAFRLRSMHSATTRTRTGSERPYSSSSRKNWSASSSYEYSSA